MSLTHLQSYLGKKSSTACSHDDLDLEDKFQLCFPFMFCCNVINGIPL